MEAPTNYRNDLFLNFSFIIDEKYKAAYCYIQKSGCSTFKVLMANISLGGTVGGKYVSPGYIILYIYIYIYIKLYVKIKIIYIFSCIWSNVYPIKMYEWIWFFEGAFILQNGLKNVRQMIVKVQGVINGRSKVISKWADSRPGTISFCKRVEELEGILRVGIDRRSLECEMLTYGWWNIANFESYAWINR